MDVCSRHGAQCFPGMCDECAVNYASERALSAAKDDVLRAAVDASLYERDMDPSEREEKHGARYDPAESSRRWEALDAAVDRWQKLEGA